jgi:undecaprenyl phosphate-alpha-L-ara4N flippase subunit ArnE
VNIVALAIVVISNVGGQLLFKLAADQVKDEANPLAMAVRLVNVPAMWAALVFYAVTTLAWVWVLRIMPLSVAYSVVALVFLLVPALAVWLYKEPVTWQLIAGAALIMVGIVLVQTQAR